MAREIIDAEFETIHRDDGTHPMRAAEPGRAAPAKRQKSAPDPRSVAKAGTEAARRTAAAKADQAATRKDTPVEKEQIDILKSEKNDAMPNKKAQILYALSVLFSAFFAFYVSGGHVLFHALPASQDGVPLALEMTPPPPAPESAVGVNVVTVSATIRNGSTSIARVPDVLLTFSPGSEGGNLVYRVPRGEMLEPGKSLAFTVRMPKKPGYVEAPRLTFDNSGV